MQTSILNLSVDGAQLAGILHAPDRPSARAVLVMVGGPQYRIGSHRQFVLLARDLAAAGFAVLRFDYRGMGDSDGESRNFEQIDHDIRAAIDALVHAVPGVSEVAIWGLCDGAAAGLLYTRLDPRVTALILLNPWVRTDETLARAYVAEYYSRRLLERDFWRKLFRGEVRMAEALASFAATVRQALGGGGSGASRGGGRQASGSLPERLRRSLEAFTGRTLIILSGRDLTAGEFRDVARTPEWQEVLNRSSVTQFTLEAADHTFSRRPWRDEVAQRCADWLRD